MAIYAPKDRPLRVLSVFYFRRLRGPSCVRGGMRISHQRASHTSMQGRGIRLSTNLKSSSRVCRRITAVWFGFLIDPSRPWAQTRASTALFRAGIEDGNGFCHLRGVEEGGKDVKAKQSGSGSPRGWGGPTRFVPDHLRWASVPGPGALTRLGVRR